MFYVVLLIFGLVLWLEVPKLLKQKWRRELVVFTVIWFLALVVTIAKTYDLPLPNPTDWLIAIFKPVSRFAEALLS